MIWPMQVKVVDARNLEADYYVQWGSITPGKVVGIERGITQDGLNNPIMILTIQIGEQ